MKPALPIDVKEWPTKEVADMHKQEFIEIVKQLARLRDLQYKKDLAEGIIQRTERIVALNLPSNLLRAAAIFVDYLHGFPPACGSFLPPAWVAATKLLPESQRGSLRCEGLKNLSSVKEGDVVVLTKDIDSDCLHAGMAGIVRELPSDEEDNGRYLIEFGEPEESITLKAEVSAAWLRPPRPGDLMENYHQ